MSPSPFRHRRAPANRRTPLRSRPRGPALLRALLILLILPFLLPPAAADSLMSMAVRDLEVPGELRDGTLVAVAGRPVLIDGAGGSAQVRAIDGDRWEPVLAAPELLARLARHPIAGDTLIDDRGRHVEVLSWDQARLRSQALPPLPEPLSDARAARFQGGWRIAGIGEDGAPRLYAGAFAGTDEGGWRRQPAWDGGAPAALLAHTGRLLVVETTAGANATHRWSEDLGWQRVQAAPGAIDPRLVRALGQAHALFAVSRPEGGRLATLNTITGAWTMLPQVLESDTLGWAPWADGAAWLARDGLHLAEPVERQPLLKWQDWVVLSVYLVLVLGVGLYFYLREKSASAADFFVGGRSIPFWAAGISLYATNVSSISFIAIPAKSFESNWQYLTNNLIGVLGLMFVAVWVVPLLRRLDLMSVFSYLETRFHPAIRMLASALCIVMQVGSRMSVILFLPSLAIATITGMDVAWSILIMGVFTIVYTALGGMRAVIWTDFVQVLVMFGGALFAIGFIFWHLDGGVSEFARVAMAEHKTSVFDFSFDLTRATVWGFLFLVVFDVVLTFPKDQVLMQRVLSTPSAREAGRSVWTFAAITIPGGILFYGIGTALYVYYQAHPERMDPWLPIDSTFPLFIAAELPTGVTGLIIAGIFAAAMSTLSSIINSVSTLLSVDFYQRLSKHPSERGSVRLAEWTTVLVGAVGMGLAWLLASYDVQSLFDVSIELAGLLGGGFAGAYTLGMFTTRANWQGVAIGIASALVVTFGAWSMDLVHPYFYLAISIMTCIVVGYLASLLFPPPAQSLAGLTIHTGRGDGAPAPLAQAARAK